MSALHWTDVEHEQTSFDGAELLEAVIVNSRSTGCTFRHAELDDAVTRGCWFFDCDFSAARLNSSRHKHQPSSTAASALPT